MAELDNAVIFKWAWWWLSDNLFQGLDDSFVSSKNIEIRDNGKSIKLLKRLEKDSSTTVVEKIRYYIKISSTELLAFGSAWWIYRRASWTWAKVVTDSPATEVLWACEFNGYIYRATAWYLHRILKTNVSNNISATDVINRQALETSTKYPMVVRTGTMYIGNGKFISSIDIGNVFVEWFNLESNASVQFLDILWSVIRATVLSDLWWYKIYLWWWINSVAPTQCIPLVWFDIKQSLIYNGYHYFITNKWLWVLDQYNVVIIKDILWLGWEVNSMTVYDNKIYIWWTWWVYCYWSKNKNYTQVLNMQLSTSNWKSTDVVWSIYSDWTDLYVSRQDSNTYWIDKLNWTNYYAQWELVTKWYFANMLYQIKEMVSLSMWYKPLLTNESIKVSYSINWWSFVEIINITSATTTKELFTEDKTLSEKFQYIQFKIELWWTTTTPEFYNLILFFNNNTRR